MNVEDGRARCNQDSEDASVSGFLHMPMPRSDAENQIYIDLIESSLATSANSPRNTLLGINEVYPQTSPRSWVLENGSPATYFNWYTGEPNDLNTEPFVLLHPTLGGKWNDISANRPNGTPYLLKIVCSYYLPVEAQGLCPWLSDFQCDLDEAKFVEAGYNYEVIVENAQNYDYFQFNAENWSNDIHIGFQNGFSGHDDSKWEIVIGGWAGTKHVIRDANASPTHGLVQKENPNR